MQLMLTCLSSGTSAPTDSQESFVNLILYFVTIYYDAAGSAQLQDSDKRLKSWRMEGTITF
jgi:hypothetical protein